MTEELTRITLALGSIEMGRPTNEWVQRDGYFYRKWTPTLHRDHYGKIVREEPMVDVIGFAGPEVERLIGAVGGTIVERQLDGQPDKSWTWPAWLLKWLRF